MEKNKKLDKSTGNQGFFYKKVLSLLVFLLVIAFYVYPQELEVSNPGFEQGETAWTIQAGGNSSATYSIDESEYYEGTKSLKAEVVTAGDNYWDIQFMNLSFAVEEGISYKASIKVKTFASGQKMNFAIGKATADYDEYASLKDEPLSTDWKEYSVTFVSPVTTNNDIRVVINLLSAGTYWFDDFKISKETVSGAEVNAAGKLIEIEMISPLMDPALESDLTFFVRNTENDYKEIDRVSISGPNKNVIRLYLNETIYRNEEISVLYYPGTVAKETGDEISAFNELAVNRSIQKMVDVENRLETSQKVGVYPNPFDDVIQIEISENHVSEIEIVDLAGKRLWNKSVDLNTNFSIDLNDLESGSYLLRILDVDQQVISIRKIIKK